MRWLSRGVALRRATAHVRALRFFGTRSVALAPKRVAAGRSKTHTAAAHGRTSSPKTSPPQTVCSAHASDSAAPGCGDERCGTNRSGRKSAEGAATAKKKSEDVVDIEEEERRLAEGDTRLAMRLLMQHHFLYQNNVRRPEERRLEEEREMLREKHRLRIERIEAKTKNAMELGPDISVDGILPLYGRGKSAAAALAPKPAASWMRLNPVEAEAEDNDGDGGEGCSMVGALLTKPDLSAYDLEHDHRIRSAEVLDEEQRRRREEIKGGDATKKLWPKEELEMGGGLTPQRVVESQMLEDEDQDFAVEAYSGDYDE